MKLNIQNIKNTAILLTALVSLASCSSAPKRTMLVKDKSASAATIYESANNELVSGEVEAAGDHLQQAYTLCVSVDDADLLSRISLSAVIYKLTSHPDVGNPENLPFYGYSPRELLDLSRSFASRSGKKDLLLSISNIYEVRIDLAENKADISQSLLKLSSVEKSLSKEPYYLAFLYRTRGDVYAADKNYAKARENYLSAGEIHTKNRYLYEIGLDYYSAARMSSLAGNKAAALSEIDRALKYDKDAENTGVIAADYYAYGIILLKGGCSEEEKNRARSAITWAAEICEAGNLPAQAAQYRKKAAEIK